MEIHFDQITHASQNQTTLIFQKSIFLMYDKNRIQQYSWYQSSSQSTTVPPPHTHTNWQVHSGEEMMYQDITL